MHKTLIICPPAITKPIGMGGSGDGEWSVHGAKVSAVAAINDAGYDAMVVVRSISAPEYHVSPPSALADFITTAEQIDKGLATETAVLQCPLVSGGRLILAPTGPLTPYDDVRSVGEAAARGVTRALKAGAKRVLLALPLVKAWPRAPLVAALAAMEALYVPLQIREWYPEQRVKATALGFHAAGLHCDLGTLLHEATALEIARGAARDIGGSDPERMTPRAVAQYVRELFPSGASAVSVRVVDDVATFEREYPLFAAVNRAADDVERHKGCIIFLEYIPKEYDRTVMFVGKGVTYDTGGCDIKAGGVMAGMSRDKCGAAAVAGFFKACELLSPRVKAVGALAMVRNSVGEQAYVADELIRSRRGAAVRVGNTDAEGRMAMADLLAEMAERALTEKQPQLYTVATLTGHAHRAYGEYAAAADNHAARVHRNAERLRAAGDALGDPVEVSTIRREDLAAHRGRCAGDHLHQADNRASVAMPRGHQGPAGFLLLAAGLDAGAVPFTHVDVAGSAGSLPAPPTASPLLALAAHCGLLSDQ